MGKLIVNAVANYYRTTNIQLYLLYTIYIPRVAIAPVLHNLMSRSNCCEFPNTIG